MSLARFHSSTKKVFATLTPYVKTLTPNIVVSGAGFLCSSVIKKAQDIPDPDLQQSIKASASYVSSFVGLFTAGNEAFELLSYMITSGVWSEMSTKQRALFVTAMILGATGITYSAVVVNQAENIFWSFNVSSAVAGIFADVARRVKNIHDEHESSPVVIPEVSPDRGEYQQLKQ